MGRVAALDTEAPRRSLRRLVGEPVPAELPGCAAMGSWPVLWAGTAGLARAGMGSFPYLLWPLPFAKGRYQYKLRVELDTWHTGVVAQVQTAYVAMDGVCAAHICSS